MTAFRKRLRLGAVVVLAIFHLAGAHAEELPGYTPVATTETPAGLILALGLDHGHEGSAALDLLHRGGGEILGFAAKASARVEVTLLVHPLCLAWARRELGETTRVKLLEIPINGGWVRDYGPIWLEKKGDAKAVRAIFDLKYYPLFRPLDDLATSKLAEHYRVPVVRNAPNTAGQLEGGNLQVDDGLGFTATPTGKLGTPIQAILSRMGCTKVQTLKSLPGDQSQHLDMFVMLATGKRAFLADFTDPADKERRQVMEENAAALTGLGYRLIRLPAPTPKLDRISESYWVFESYANAVLCGDFAFVPEYGRPEDEAACKVFAGEGFKVTMVPAKSLAELGGGLHCVAAERR
ncbi:MAG: agmatine deiminase family protein [Chthoniobacter sp.]|nr:agmatine deiminase family protein [Chthoniobacter sp.]